MRTVAQKRRRAAMLKTASIALAGAVILTPRFENFEFPDVSFPLVSTAIAAPLE
jgi:hypothetical protein